VKLNEPVAEVAAPAPPGLGTSSTAPAPALDATRPPEMGEESRLRSFASRRRTELTLVLVMLVIGIVATSASPVFLTWGNWKTVLIQASFVGMLACGMTVLMVSGGIDLSVGMAVSFAGMVLGTTLIEHGLPLGIAIALAILVATGVGLVNGVLAANSVAHPFILTLGTMTLLQGAALAINNDPIIGFPEGLLNAMAAQPLGIPIVVLIFAGVAVVCHILLSQTVIGRHVQALGGSHDAARLAGVRVQRLTIGLYGFMGLLVGVTAVLMSATLSSAGPQAGRGMELMAIAAVAVGGTPLQGGRGGVPGTLLGLVLIVMIGNVLNLLSIDPNLQYIVVGAIIVTAVMGQGRRRSS
jgi:ribose/xylose/arabinose/galactoside ABC-type transport system permease subunit